MLMLPVAFLIVFPNVVGSDDASMLPSKSSEKGVDKDKRQGARWLQEVACEDGVVRILLERECDDARFFDRRFQRST